MTFREYKDIEEIEDPWEESCNGSEDEYGYSTPEYLLGPSDAEMEKYPALKEAWDNVKIENAKYQVMRKLVGK